jgi:zinc transporter ZupT
VFAVSEQAVSNPSLSWFSALFAVGLAIIHLYSGKLRFLDEIPRSRWLSMASGVSVAYVFVHLLPDLNARQNAITQTGVLGFLEHHVYLIALLGLVAFYGLERTVRTSHKREQKSPGEETIESGVFWLHIGSFALYNGLIGYLLMHPETPDIRSLFLFFMAMGLHFIVNDYGLRQDHQGDYHNKGRWILAAAIIVGWAIGQGTEIHEAAIAVLFAFLAGGIMLNVLKEELPEERKSRFWAFAAGAIAYSTLLLTL